MRFKSIHSLFALATLLVPSRLARAGTLTQCMNSLTLSPNSYKERDDGYVVDMRIVGGNPSPCTANYDLEFTIPSIPGAICQGIYFYQDGAPQSSQTFYCYPPYNDQGYQVRFPKNSAFALAGTLSDGSGSTPAKKNFPVTIRKSDLQVRLESCASSLKLGPVINTEDGFTYIYTRSSAAEICSGFSVRLTDPAGVVTCSDQYLYPDPTSDYAQPCSYKPIMDDYKVDLKVTVMAGQDLIADKGTQTFSPTGISVTVNAIRCAKGLVYSADGQVSNDGTVNVKLTTVPTECYDTTNNPYGFTVNLYYGPYDYQYCSGATITQGSDTIFSCTGRNEDGSNEPFDVNGVTLPMQRGSLSTYYYYGINETIASKSLTWGQSVVETCQDSFASENFALTSTSATAFDLIISGLSSSCEGTSFYVGTTSDSTDSELYCIYVDFDAASKSITTTCYYSGGRSPITFTPTLYSNAYFTFERTFVVPAPSNGANCLGSIALPDSFKDLPQANSLVTVNLDFDPAQCNGATISLYDEAGLTCPTTVIQSGDGYIQLLCNVNGQAPGAYTVHPKLNDVAYPATDLAFTTSLDELACGQSVIFTSVADAGFSYTFYASDTKLFPVKIDYRADYCDSSFEFSPILQDFTTPDPSSRRKRTVTYDCGSLSGSASGTALYTCGVTQGAMPTGDWGVQVTPCPAGKDVMECYYASTGFGVTNLDSSASPPPSKRNREEDQVIIAGSKGSSRKCNPGLTPCPLPGRALLWECVDIYTSLDTCGGCWNTRETVDCGELEGVENVACVAGTCVASSCMDDFMLLGNKTCVAV